MPDTEEAMTDIDARLAPCPFCGSRNVAQGASQGYISVWCFCGARGPEVPFPDDCDPLPPIKECHAAWNRRAALPAGEAKPVRVKPLEWDQHNRADVYSVNKSYGQGPKVYFLSRGSDIIDWFDNAKEAQAAAQADYEQRVRSALIPAPQRGASPVAPTHRHKKRGSEYVLLGLGRMQAGDWTVPEGNDPTEWRSVDMREVAIYRSTDDGSFWCAPREEFEDGRYEVLSAPQSPAPASAVTVSDEMVGALTYAEAAFEEIRLILIHNLDEPERQAFWKAVAARDWMRAALASSKE